MVVKSVFPCNAKPEGPDGSPFGGEKPDGNPVTRDKGEYVPCAKLARLHLLAGERERALSLLPKAAEERNVYSLLIARDPVYDSLKNEARFAKVLASMNLPKWI